MAEQLIMQGQTKEERYRALLPQVAALIADEPDMIANQANLAAVLRECFGFFWVGFYRVHGQELVLGPFQGPIACTRIAKGKGVCGTAWAQGESIVVPDVDQFPGHIACSSLSRSEIVVPMRNAAQEVIAVLDVDSDRIDSFDSVDRYFLEAMVALLEEREASNTMPSSASAG